MSTGRSRYLRNLYGFFSSRFDQIMNILYRGNDRIWREVAIEELPSDGALLEVGAGTGRTELLGTSTDSHISLDISRRMLLQAESMETPIEGDVHSLPFASNSFDSVLAVLLFSTQINQAAAVAEMGRVCKNGGTIVLVDAFADEDYGWRYLDTVKTVLTYPLAFDFTVQITELAQQAGLSVMKRERLPNNMNLTELVVIRC